MYFTTLTKILYELNAIENIHGVKGFRPVSNQKPRSRSGIFNWNKLISPDKRLFGLRK